MKARQVSLIVTAMLFLTQWCCHQMNSVHRTRQISGNAEVTHADVKVEITEDEARRLAEEFIVHNGYTDIPVDESEVVLESDDGTDKVEALRLRASTLEATAYEVRRRPDRWIVIFRFNAASAWRHKMPGFSEYLKSNGRALIMDLAGHGLHLEHQDIKLLN